MRRRGTALLLAACTALALGGDAGAPFVDSGGALSASAMRAALDARAEVRELVRDQLIDVRRTQIYLRDRVAFLEEESSTASAASVADAPHAVTESLQSGADPWTEAGIVAGSVANAADMNTIFEAWVTDVSNFREFQSLLIREQDALYERIEALEVGAGILDPPTTDPLVPNEAEFSVPHTFMTGSVMRASEMNANLEVVDAGFAEEGTMAAAIATHLGLLEERVDTLEVALGFEPTFTWRMVTVNSVADIETEAVFTYRSVGPFEPFTITVTGPAGFERSVTATRAGRAGVDWMEPLLPSGTYTAVTTVSGVDFALPIAFDASRVLELPTVTVQTASTTEVVVSIGRVEGATFYSIQVREADGPMIQGRWSNAFGDSTQTVTFPDLDLDPSMSYVAVVTASNVTVVEGSSSPQANRSEAVTEPFSPSVGE